MLKSLHVHNFALIADAMIELEPGFNVFSGETGAGKSILIDALGIVLGNRASTEYIRDGEDHFWVQAVFDISDLCELGKILEEYGIEVEEDYLFLRRKVAKSGKSLTTVNGIQVPLALLQQLSEQLLDIHGQHENQRLLKSGEPLNLIDLYGSMEIDVLLRDYRAKYAEYVDLKQELEDLDVKNANRGQIAENLEWEINEIESAALSPGEEDALQETAKKLTNSTKIIGAASSSYELLNGNENGMPGILDNLSEVRNKLAGIISFDKEIENFYNIFESAWLTLEDARQSLGLYIENNDFDPAYLTKVQERLDLLFKLKKKYGPGLEDVLGYLLKAKAQLSELESLTEKIEQKQKLLHSLSDSLKIKAGELTCARKKIAGLFSELVSQHIKDLAMPQGEFRVQLSVRPEFGPAGCDEAQFYFTANLGQEFRLLTKVASGGELSRVALAIKTVLLEKSGVPTMVFDEIDSGVGGVTAQKMAEKIAIIASMRQVLCVTHLAQIASFADNHLYIEKIVKDDKTITCFKALDKQSRVDEIMRMAGGSNITEASRLNAEQLLAMADKIKNDLRKYS